MCCYVASQNQHKSWVSAVQTCSTGDCALPGVSPRSWVPLPAGVVAPPRCCCCCCCCCCWPLAAGGVLEASATWPASLERPCTRRAMRGGSGPDISPACTRMYVTKVRMLGTGVAASLLSFSGSVVWQGRQRPTAARRLGAHVGGCAGAVTGTWCSVSRLRSM